MNTIFINIKKILCVTLLMTGAVDIVSAQSNVTIYGLLNLGVAKESGTPTKEERGYQNWLGFRGIEDFGNGIAATFNLQTRFLTDTGGLESSVFWHGESTVGLRSNSLGSVRLGRALTPMWALKYQFEPWGDSWLMGSVGKYQAGGRYITNPAACPSDCPGFARWNNGVFFETPVFGSFQLSVAGQTEVEPGAQKRGSGFSLNYQNGPISAMLSGEKNTLDHKVVYVAGKYDFGFASVMGSVSRNTVPSTSKEQNMIVAGTYMIGENSSLRAAYGKNTTVGDHKLSGGYVYSFSKRTSIYGDVYREKTVTNLNGVGLGIQHAF